MGRVTPSHPVVDTTSCRDGALREPRAAMPFNAAGTWPHQAV
jgi:hypothetical protein